jgi:hypothetical protein
VSRGSRREAKDTWWWNDEVQKAIKEKNDCFQRLYLDRSVDNIDKYKTAKKATKRAVSEARGRAYEGLYQCLDTKEGERDTYQMAKIRERKTGDVDQVKCIKDGADQLLMKDEEIKHRWREYFNKLFNGDLIFQANKMPEEWSRSILVPIFKNKGDVQSCTNYRGIKLMNHTMKLWETH